MIGALAEHNMEHKVQVEVGTVSGRWKLQRNMELGTAIALGEAGQWKLQ